MKDTNNKLVLENQTLLNDNVKLQNELRELKEGLQQNELNTGNINSSTPLIGRIDEILVELEWCIDHMDA
ncbi:MAG: hypothetical protein ISP67_07160 [Flavobacteriaceae bacterium]|nr:hypothetical protein [Flavobacteriaceae bacterium]